MSGKGKIFLGTLLLVLSLSVNAQSTFIFDLENLRNQDSFLTRAYDIIKVQGAWEFIKNSAATLSFVSIGIVDTGIDAIHQEFNNPKVDFGLSPTTALIDSDAPKGHGTQVVGIIGANNVLGAGGVLVIDSPQINGIVSGALKETQYKLEVENFRTATTAQLSGVFAALEVVLKRNPAIVNMSFGAPKCSATSLEDNCYKTDADFIDAFGVYIKIFNALENQDTMFVVAAGNWDIDTRLNVLPATIRLSNLITIGATDLDDERATFRPLTGLKSNFGSDVDISAPGVFVYAPKPGNIYDVPRKILGIPVPGSGFGGTSASAPMVTGVAGILKALEPEYQKTSSTLEMNPSTIKTTLISSADPIDTGEPDKPLGKDCFNFITGTHTGCRLNAHRAVAWWFPPAAVQLNQPTTVLAQPQTLFLQSTPPLPIDLNEILAEETPPGFIEGTGTHFEITDSGYLNITLDSTEEITLWAESVPNVINLIFSSSTTATSTEITISNLEPTKQYYLYQDEYGNVTQFTADQNGVYSYTQDLTDPHFIFIQEEQSTFFIVDGPTGGHCTLIGNWDVNTKTCTLTQDVSGPIQVSSSITLDGNNHTVDGTGTNSFAGILLFRASGVTLKNLQIRRYNNGILLNRSSRNTITNNTILDNLPGIRSVSSHLNTINGNTIENNGGGITLNDSGSNRIYDNSISSNRFVGLVIINFGSQNNWIADNIIAENGSRDVFLSVPRVPENCTNQFVNNTGTGGNPIKVFGNTQALVENEALSLLILCNADNSIVRDVTVESSPTLKNNGLYLIKTDFALIENNTITNTGDGIRLRDSTNNRVLQNALEDNILGVGQSAGDSNTIESNTITNNVLGIHMSNGPTNSEIFGNTIQGNRFGVNLSGGNHKVYNNNFINNTRPARNCGGFGCLNNLFNLPLPIGGNFWNDFDEPSEGCNDTNNDRICDSPRPIFNVGNPVSDNFPWTTQNGWEGPQEVDIEISWTPPQDFASTTPDFISYKIFRNPTGNVTTSDTLVATINNQNITAFIDENLDAGQTYYYKVFTFDGAGLFIGSNEESIVL